MGCGDIIWEQSIAQDFIDMGYQVLWPVDTVYAPMAKHFPCITMIDKSLVNVDWNNRSDYIINGCRIIPMRFTDSIMQVPYTSCMMSKYSYLNKDWTKWKDNCKIVRDTESENKLYYDVLGLKDGEEYNLISQQWGNAGHRKNEITMDNGLRNIEITLLPNYTLIDWMKAIENATEIFAISSACIYLFELYDLKTKQINLFKRHPVEQNHDNYSYILQKHKYILH